MHFAFSRLLFPWLLSKPSLGIVLSKGSITVSLGWWDAGLEHRTSKCHHIPLKHYPILPGFRFLFAQTVEGGGVLYPRMIKFHRLTRFKFFFPQMFAYLCLICKFSSSAGGVRASSVMRESAGLAVWTRPAACQSFQQVPIGFPLFPSCSILLICRYGIIGKGTTSGHH